VTGAIKDEGTIESCSIATLLKITSAFYKLFFTENIWLEKACQVLHVKVTLVQGSIVKICLLKWEKRTRRSTQSA
jgi:hypothetical protein